MGRAPVALALAVALAAPGVFAFAGCRPAAVVPEAPEAATSPPEPAAEATAEVAAPPAPPPEPVAEAAGADAPVPLDSLLKLPPAPAGGPGEKVKRVLEERRPASGAAAEGGDRKLKVDFGAQREQPTARPERRLDQIDAGASVPVDANTRIRGGVRVEREDDGEAGRTTDTRPMLGVEKRF